MKVYRYMSMNEFKKFVAGYTLTKNERGCRNRWSGELNPMFYFLPEVTNVGNMEWDRDFPALEAYRCFYGGIVTEDVLVEFETSVVMEETSGNYLDWYGDEVYADELCVPTYGRTRFIPLRYCFNALVEEKKWRDASTLPQIDTVPLTYSIADVVKKAWAERCN